jgi:formylmethanofuran dehydrogenase subunit B
MPSSTVRSAICLGCGCVCDDLSIRIDGGRIAGVENACSLGLEWLRDGDFPAKAQSNGVEVSLEHAVRAAADLLFASPRRTLIYIADDVTCAAQGEAAALVDRIGATIDGPACDTVADGLLAAQRRGRASATLGELRHRADVVIFWGVDPTARYPRFLERFVNAAPAFARSRALIAIDVGENVGPAACLQRLNLTTANEVEALSVARAVLRGRETGPAGQRFAEIVALAERLKSQAKYVAIVFDAEPAASDRDRDLPEGLAAFTQALNASTRAALFALRAGGNRNGLESLLTWQTGFPFAVDFTRGDPHYAADETLAQRLSRGRYGAALIVGSTTSLPPAVAAELAHLPTVIVGPRASQASFSPQVAIDTGAAALHEEGLVLRMDDVPLPAPALLSHPHSALEVLRLIAVHAPQRMVGTT